MKTSIIIASLILCCSVNSINAQWYSNKYGVENLNDLSDEQLMESYSNAIVSTIVGGVATGTGIVLVISGMGKAFEGFSSLSYPTPDHRSHGGGLFISGAVLAIGGTILLISGGSRIGQLRPIKKSRGLVSNISVYPGAGYELLTDTYYPAVTIRIGF
jgi:hypothetical protein